MKAPLFSVIIPLTASLLVSAGTARAEVRTRFEHLPLESGTGFAFKQMARPARNDAAAGAKVTLASGERDRNGGPVAKLNDGRLPTEDDQPSQNFFFSQGSEGGRIVLDLGKVIGVKEVRTYSRHRDHRAPQVYKLYGTDGMATGFNAQPGAGVDPVASGWKLIAEVDTRPRQGEPGGTHGATVSDSLGALGKYQYLLLDTVRTRAEDGQSLTFFSEIDVIDAAAPAAEEAEEAVPPIVLTSADGKYRYSIDTSLAPDLTQWAEKELGPVIIEWYPKIVAMLPSDGFEAPTRVAFEFRDDMGGTPASAGGNRVNINNQWFRRNLQGEARGAVVHELVHVVQQYGRGRRGQNAMRTPGWIGEGLPDYIRWFLYEPQTRGAEISARALPQARYDASYRTSANFINWVTNTYDKDLPRKVNAAAREGRYTDEIWKELTGKTVQELGEEWKKAIGERLAANAAAPATGN